MRDLPDALWFNQYIGVATESQSQLFHLFGSCPDSVVSSGNLLLWCVLPILSLMVSGKTREEVKSGWQLRQRPRPMFLNAEQQRRRAAFIANGGSEDAFLRVVAREVASARRAERVRRGKVAGNVACIGVCGGAVHDERAAPVHVHSAGARDGGGVVADARSPGFESGGRASLGGRGALAVSISQAPAWWQRVLHGEQTLLREEVTLALLERHGEKSAFRYAACGLGDLVVKDKNGIHTAPMGCGHRLCPRCGRTKGRPMIKRIFGWLAAVAHQDIFTMCLTQRVDASESLPAARKRMLRKEHEYLERLKAAGMVSGASSAHTPWSAASNGWHYHVHLVLELPAGEWDCEKLRALYREVAGCEEVQTDDKCASIVCSAGPADGSLVGASDQPDFWVEQKSGLAAAVQYPVRDIAQGVSAERLGGDRQAVATCVRVLLDHAKGWKLRRTFGQWRKNRRLFRPTPR